MATEHCRRLERKVAMDYETLTTHPMGWIYAHIVAEDRKHVEHDFVLVGDEDADSPAGFVYVTRIWWRFGDNQIVLGSADEMVRAVKDEAGRDYPEVMLLDLKKQLGVETIPGEYNPLEEKTIINPVGRPWPEESDKRGIACHHPVTGLEADELLADWTDNRGQFALRSGMQWVAKYYYYVRVR